ncbi:NAD(+) diphosphatase [Gorillibacterium sp. sgz500922]|uniref:NAD(+) diphosphatase n=1 Tax=Gorillibacterium sp. sgz500922 TaxID=3446694 RepID=UPI003F667D1A
MKLIESLYTHYHPAFLPGPELDPESAAYWFVADGDKLLVEETSARLPMLSDPQAEEWGISNNAHYLGTWRGIPCWAAEAPASLPLAASGYAYHRLLRLYDGMSENFFFLAGRAVQIVAWARTHRFCGTCGSPTVPSGKDYAMTCPACGSSSYPRLAPAMIVAILKGNKILLAHHKRFPAGRFGLISGFAEPGETLEDCVRREVREEIGIEVSGLRYFGSQPWPFPHSLMIGFLAVWQSGEIAVDNEEILEADWFEADGLPDIPPPASIARKMIDWFREEYSGK